MALKRRKTLAAAAVLAIAGVACGGGGTGGGGDEGKTVKIGFISPLTGALGPFGKGMQHSAQAAIDEANKSSIVAGWKIELVAKDDAADATQGANGAQQLAADPEVAAVIGTLNSSVAQAVQPVLKDAGIAMVSPANTNSGLTMGQNWETAPARPFANYFRVVTHDGLQGPFAAKYAQESLKRKRVVTIHDKKAYGQGLVASFSKAFKEGGGQIADALEINPGEGDYKAAITRAKAKTPDIIYYGGEFPEAGVLAKNMDELGLKPPAVVLMGGDGVVDDKFGGIAGAAAEGNYATLVGASADVAPNAKAFVNLYNSKQYAEPMSAFGPPTYDATNIIIEALANALRGKDKIDASVRKAIVEAIQDSDHNGVLGHTTFNEFGDTTNKLISVMKWEGSSFKALEARNL